MSLGGKSQGKGRTILMGTKRVDVYLNIYDLTPAANTFLHPFGFGIHHSGVEILGSEFSFASGIGILSSAPKDGDENKNEPVGAIFRERIKLGSFHGGIDKLNRAISDLRNDFARDTYNLFTRNCNHFANALVRILLNKTIPPYVNRIAHIGSYFSCLLPPKLLGAGGGGGVDIPNNYRRRRQRRRVTTSSSHRRQGRSSPTRPYPTTSQRTRPLRRVSSQRTRHLSRRVPFPPPQKNPPRLALQLQRPVVYDHGLEDHNPADHVFHVDTSVRKMHSTTMSRGISMRRKTKDRIIFPRHALHPYTN